MQREGRTLTHAARETLRIRAVRRVKAGERPRAVIQGYGLCRTTSSRRRRAYERDPAAIAPGQRVDYPRLQQRAKRRGADLFVLDEAGVRAAAPWPRTWGAKGQTPVGATRGQHSAVTALSAVKARGAFGYNVYTGRLNAARFSAFLKDVLAPRQPNASLRIRGAPDWAPIKRHRPLARSVFHAPPVTYAAD